MRFIDPYKEAPAHERDHVCEPVSFEMIDDMSASITYNTYLERFVLLGISHKYDRARKEQVWGIYFSLSRDLVNWSTRRLIVETEAAWTHRCEDPDPISYPALLDPSSRSRNFATTGKRPFLYGVRTHYVGCRPTLNRDLVRARIEFAK